MDLQVVASRDELARSAADVVERFVHERGRVLLGLAGGSTPRATHTELTDRAIDWSTTTAWIPDERWVAPDHDDANQRMARETLTDATGVSLMAPDTTMATPDACASAYGPPVVDLLEDASISSLTMLGMGTDGHTASLFPGTRAVDDPRVAYVANDVPQLGVQRLTATFKMLALSDIVLFLVAGRDKAEMIASIASGADLPAARVEARERVVWVLDADAASLLP